MIETILNIAGFLLQTEQQQKDAIARKLAEMSTWDKLIFALEDGGYDLTSAIIGIVLMFVAAVFIMLFIRRWNLSRLGFFLITVTAFGVRTQNPSDKFWTAFAFMAGLFAFGMFIFSFKQVDFDTKKEPMYHLLNGFALMLIAFPMGQPVDFYMGSLALVALISSLFFIISKKHDAKGHFLKNQGDEMILNSLEKKQKSSNL